MKLAGLTIGELPNAAGDFGVKDWEDGVVDRLYPGFNAWPMGFAHSQAVAQYTHLEALDKWTFLSEEMNM